jgi:hypothetical protein
MLVSSVFIEAHPRPLRNPSHSSKVFSSQAATFWPTLCHHKSFSCNTYGPPRKCCKQKTYNKAKLFRCNTYKKHGVPIPQAKGFLSPFVPGLRSLLHNDSGTILFQSVGCALFCAFLHFFASIENSTFFFSSDSALFAQKPGMRGILPILELATSEHRAILTSLPPYFLSSSWRRKLNHAVS